MKKKMKEDWQQVDCKLFRSGRRMPLTVKSKRAVYDIEFERGKFHPTAVTAFLALDTGRSWLGPAQEYYVDTGTQIVGFVLREGNIIWCDSLSSKVLLPSEANRASEELLNYFEQKVSAENVLEAYAANNPRKSHERTTGLRKAIPTPWFFDKAPFSSEVGNPKIVAAERDDGNLKLTLTNEAGDLSATVIVNIQTREAVASDEAKATAQ